MQSGKGYHGYTRTFVPLIRVGNKEPGVYCNHACVSNRKKSGTTEALIKPSKTLFLFFYQRQSLVCNYKDLDVSDGRGK